MICFTFVITTSERLSASSGWHVYALILGGEYGIGPGGRNACIALGWLNVQYPEQLS
jgi:hypothetical protein